MCFESKVNIWLSKHHTQHIAVALGLFSSISNTQKFKGGFSYGKDRSRCTTGLLCFHSSNRPCVIPKSVSGSGYQKTIVCCLSIFSGVYLSNGRRCGYCISLIGNFLCTFIHEVRGYVGISHFVSKSEDLMAYHILFLGIKNF